MYQFPQSTPVTSVPVFLNMINTSAVATSGATPTVHASPPAAHASPPAAHVSPPVEWSTDLCDCCSNFELCCLTFWCPCITFGRVAEIIDKGSTSCFKSGAMYTLMCCSFGCGSFYASYYRIRMKEQLGFKAECFGDCIKHCCCSGYCALCQEYRELRNRGFNMLTGWEQNVKQQTRGKDKSRTAPPVVSDMHR